MAITKIRARSTGLKGAIDYVLNGDKTDDFILTYRLNCEPNFEYRQMMDTKRDYGKLDGRQCYHIIQSFRPGEVTPQLALEIAKEFAHAHLSEYQVVIGTHVDRGHVHSHILFNSVNMESGEKYHSPTSNYYNQIRAISDRLCLEHGLSVLTETSPAKGLTYIEWLRQSKGQPTFRTMLEADMKQAIEDANDFGNFLVLMEHLGYEVKHGNRLGFRLRGQERFQYPGRRNPMYTEDGIRAAIDGNMDAIMSGQKPPMAYRAPYVPYKKRSKHKGFMALYVHYLYILGKIEKRQFPPKMSDKTKAAIMQFEKYREQFRFLNENGITTREEMAAFVAQTEEKLVGQIKQRTVLNVRKKKRKHLYHALADADLLAPVVPLYQQGLTAMKEDYERYQQAMQVLAEGNTPTEVLTTEKQEVYEALATINREIRQSRKTLAMCKEIEANVPRIQQEIERTESKQQQKTKNRGEVR